MSPIGRRLQLYRSTYERAAAQSKSPRQMRRTADTDAFVRHNIESRARVSDEAVARIGAQIHFMISARYSECLRDFARAGAESTEIINATAALHQFDASPRLERTN